MVRVKAGALKLYRNDKTLKARIKNRRLVASSDDAYRLKRLTRQTVA